MIRKTAAALLLGALSSAPAWASETYAIDKGHSEAGFQVRHLVSKVHGRFNDFEGVIQVDQAKPEASTVSFAVKTASIDTSNPDRDKDLRSPNFFDVQKYPEMTFKSSKVVAKDKDHFDVTGTLSLHGVSKEVTVAVAFSGFAKDPWGGERAGFDVTTALNRKDFGMVWNKTLDNGGVLLGDDVQIQIAIEAVKKAPGAK
jgi:polyisoprenoid-binding protein YceI